MGKKIEALKRTVAKAIGEQPIVDIHTHVYDPAMGKLLLWGVDELLTYHYLVAEVFRARPEMKYETFWAMSKREQADLIWRELFIERSPISEACRGVVTVFTALGFDPNTEDLSGIREYFAGETVRNYVDTVFKTANLGKVYMTNDPLDPTEGPVWQKGFERDPRFLAVLRLDSALMNWPQPVEKLRALGYDVEEWLSERTIGELRRYLGEWTAKMDARCMAISLPPSFSYPDESSSVTILMTKAVFPTTRDLGIPVAMMIGVRKRVNPALGDAGDSLGQARVETVERLAAEFPDVKCLVTMLSRENQHELCIAARKFSNIHFFGCWWFLNNPSIIEEMTAERFELLGLSFTPQHSDARVLDQLIYKWSHSRKIIADVMAQKYMDLADAGWDASKKEIRRDVAALLEGRAIERAGR